MSQSHQRVQRRRKPKRKKLERAGWKAGSVQEFQGVSDEEAAMVERKLAPSTAPLTLPRTVLAPAPIGPGAVNRILSVVLEEDQDVIWEWTPLPGGGRFVSGYTVVPRLPGGGGQLQDITSAI